MDINGQNIEFDITITDGPKYDVESIGGPPGQPGKPGEQGMPGQGVPVGGSTDQVLVKKSDDDYDTEWHDSGSGGAVDSVNGKTGIVELDASDIKALSGSSSGNPIQINSPSIMDSLSLEGETVQAGSGDPSPTNIRPIGARRFRYLEFTGNESFAIRTSADTIRFQIDLGVANTADRYPSGNANINTKITCTHFDNKLNTANEYFAVNLRFNVSTDTHRRYLNFTHPDFTTATEFKAWLAEQYNAGTPVRIWYELSPEATTSQNYGAMVQTGSGNPSPTNIKTITPIETPNNLFGQNGVYDEYNETGMVTRRLRAKVLNGSENWTVGSNANFFSMAKADFDPQVKASPDDQVTNIVCSHYLAKSRDDMYNNNTIGVGINFEGDLSIHGNGITSTAAFKAWLAENNVIIIYELAAPITEYLTPLVLPTLTSGDSTIAGSGKMTVRYCWTPTESYDLATMRYADTKAPKTNTVTINEDTQQLGDNPVFTVSGGGTLYSEIGQNIDGALTQKAVTDMIWGLDATDESKVDIRPLDNKEILSGAGSVSLLGQAINSGTIAIGRSSRAKNDGVAVGGYAKAESGNYGVAVGTYSNSNSSTVVGGGSVTARSSTFSVGSGDTNIDRGTRYIANVRDPMYPQDATTKNYVDSKMRNIAKYVGLFI